MFSLSDEYGHGILTHCSIELCLQMAMAWDYWGHKTTLYISAEV